MAILMNSQLIALSSVCLQDWTYLLIPQTFTQHLLYVPCLTLVVEACENDGNLVFVISGRTNVDSTLLKVLVCAGSYTR